jgi:hypothetical protein
MLRFRRWPLAAGGWLRAPIGRRIAGELICYHAHGVDIACVAPLCVTLIRGRVTPAPPATVPLAVRLPRAWLGPWSPGRPSARFAARGAGGPKLSLNRGVPASPYKVFLDLNLAGWNFFWGVWLEFVVACRLSLLRGRVAALRPDARRDWPFCGLLGVLGLPTRFARRVVAGGKHLCKARLAGRGVSGFELRCRSKVFGKERSPC